MKISPILLFVYTVLYISPLRGNIQNRNDELSITLSTNNAHAKTAITFSVPKTNGYRSIRWFFGDGTDAFGYSVQKIYDSAGTYDVKAVIITDLCSSIILQKQVSVTNGISASIANVVTGNGKVWVMAHRGNTGDKHIPENSISALNACIAAGVDVMEIDTHLTKDGHIIVCHDRTIDRTTNGSGNIADLTLAQIRSYRLKDRNGNITNEKMPTLEELLLAGKNKIFFNLDYSPRTASTQQVYEIVQNCEMTDEVFFYTGTSAKYVSDLFSLSLAAHPLIWASMTANYMPLLDQNRKFFVQLDYENRNDGYLQSVIANGLLLQYNVLNNIDAEFANGNYDKINELLTGNHPASMIQTDYAYKLVNYLKNIGRH